VLSIKLLHFPPTTQPDSQHMADGVFVWHPYWVCQSSALQNITPAQGTSKNVTRSTQHLRRPGTRRTRFCDVINSPRVSIDPWLSRLDLWGRHRIALRTPQQKVCFVFAVWNIMHTPPAPPRPAPPRPTKDAVVSIANICVWACVCLPEVSCQANNPAFSWSVCPLRRRTSEVFGVEMEWVVSAYRGKRLWRKDPRFTQLFSSSCMSSTVQ